LLARGQLQLGEQSSTKSSEYLLLLTFPCHPKFSFSALFPSRPSQLCLTSPFLLPPLSTLPYSFSIAAAGAPLNRPYNPPTPSSPFTALTLSTKPIHPHRSLRHPASPLPLRLPSPLILSPGLRSPPLRPPQQSPAPSIHPSQQLTSPRAPPFHFLCPLLHTTCSPVPSPQTLTPPPFTQQMQPLTPRRPRPPPQRNSKPLRPPLHASKWCPLPLPPAPFPPN
jgi:hypothetical protein